MSKPLGNVCEFVPALGNEALQVVAHTRRDRLPSHPSANGAIRNIQVMSEGCLPLRPVERSSNFDEKIERHSVGLQFGHHPVVSLVRHGFGVARPSSINHLLPDFSLNLLAVFANVVDRGGDGRGPIPAGNLLAGPERRAKAGTVDVQVGPDLILTPIVGQDDMSGLGQRQVAVDGFPAIAADYGVSGHGSNSLSSVVAENPKRAVVAGECDIPAGLTVAGVGVKVEIVLRPLGQFRQLAAIVQPLLGPIAFCVGGAHERIPSGVNVAILVNVFGVDGEQFPVIVTEFQPVPEPVIKAGFAVEFTREILEVLEHELRVGFIGMNGATCRIEQFRRVAEIQVHPLTSDAPCVVLGIGADIDGRRVIGNHRVYSLVSGLIAIDASPTDWRRKKSGFDLVAPEITLAAKVLPNGGIAAESGNGPVEVFEVRNGVFHAFGLESQARVTNAFNVAAGNGFHGVFPSVVGLIATTASHTDWQGKESDFQAAAAFRVIHNVATRNHAEVSITDRIRAIVTNGRRIDRPANGGKRGAVELIAQNHRAFHVAQFVGFVHFGSPVSAKAIKHGAHNLICAEFGEGSGTGGVVPAGHAGIIPAVAGIAPELADKVHLQGRIGIKRSLVSGSVFRGNHIGSPSHRRPQWPSNEPNVVLNSGRVNTEMQLAA